MHVYVCVSALMCCCFCSHCFVCVSWRLVSRHKAGASALHRHTHMQTTPTCAYMRDAHTYVHTQAVTNIFYLCTSSVAKRAHVEMKNRNK